MFIEETVKRIESYQNVQAVLIVNQEGVPIYSSSSHEDFSTDHAVLISQLTAKAKTTIRNLDPTDDMTFLRIRSKKHEVMIVPGALDFVLLALDLSRLITATGTDKEYALIVIQNLISSAELDTNTT